jgi:uncharacterized protein YrrD
LRRKSVDNNRAIRKWSELQELPVILPKGGMKLGILEDFYFKPGTNSIDSFLVNTGLTGYRALPVTAITEVGRESITIVNEEALISRLPLFPLGQSLLSYKVESESGNEVGRIGSVLLAVTPPEVLRIAGYELAIEPGKHGRGPRRFDANDVISDRQKVLVISDQDAHRLR